MSGAYTPAWLIEWREISDGFDPDVVVLVFFLRDGTHATDQRLFFRPIRDQIMSQNHATPLYRWSYAYRTWRDRADRIRIQETFARRLRDGYLGDEAQTAEWRAAQRNLLELRDRVRARHAVFAMVVFPILVQLDERYPFRGVCDRVTAFAEGAGIPTFSLLPTFEGQNTPDLWVSALDQHPNEKAHAMVADALAPFVTRLLSSAQSHGQEQRR